MLKRIILSCFLIALASTIVAGDVSAYVDEGFSADGKIYVFGQYGSIDKTWQGYASIYTVDIEKNDYVDGAVFSTPASSKTAGKNGHTLYTDLRNKNASYLSSLGLTTVGIDNVLYLASDSNVATDKIVITDFEQSNKDDSNTYNIKLTPWYSGNTSLAKSSFFITVEKQDDKGEVIAKQVIGNPDIKRNGVIGYSIEKIIKSPDEKSFIFLIEKTHATSNGISKRYMVETLEVSNF